MEVVNGVALKAAIKHWLATQSELVDEFTCESVLVAIDTIKTVMRKHTCPHCRHEWLEDCDASDYPNYCPACGEPLRKED